MSDILPAAFTRNCNADNDGSVRDKAAEGGEKTNEHILGRSRRKHPNCCSRKEFGAYASIEHFTVT